jgi:putative membrane protein
MMGWGMMDGWYGGGSIFMLVFLVALAILIFFLINQNAKGGAAGETALDILKQRYAKGEIGKEEFEAKKKDLQA